MGIQIHWYAQGQVIELEVDGMYEVKDVHLLDFGLQMYLNTTSHEVIHFIIDGQLIPYCMLIDSLRHEKTGWVVERSETHSPFGRVHRFQHASSTQGALMLLASLSTTPATHKTV